MRTEYLWAKDISCKLTYKDGSIRTIENAACFSSLPDTSGVLKSITIYNTRLEQTLEYRDAYLNYVKDMLKLDAIIEEDGFTFKAFNCNIKNLAVCSIVRLLWEKLGCSTPKIQTHNVFLKPLLRSGKCKFRNKLKRFCYFYKETLMPEESTYWHDGHSWRPKLTEIKSTQQFLSTKKFETVNKFFTTNG